MTTIETRKYEMLARVREFGKTYGDRFPESTLAGKMFATVGTAVGQLDAHAVSKLSTAHGGLSARDLARAALIDHLLTISQTARAMAVDTPGLDDKFQLPNRPTGQALLAVGRLFARDAEAFKSAFAAHGLAKTSLTELEDLIGQYDQAIRDRSAGKDERTAARASITAALASGTAATRKLDVIVPNRLRDDPVAMAVWDRDRRIDYPPARPQRPPSRNSGGNRVSGTNASASLGTAGSACTAGDAAANDSRSYIERTGGVMKDAER